jgi:hypothetical protein
MTKQERYNSLLPDGKPKWIRVYDNNGKSFDRYTCVFTGKYTHKTSGEFWYLGMSSSPSHPQGFGQHGSSPFQPIDKPTYSHIGKKIKFEDLPEGCQELVKSDYLYLWDFTDENGNVVKKYENIVKL